MIVPVLAKALKDDDIAVRPVRGRGLARISPLPPTSPPASPRPSRSRTGGLGFPLPPRPSPACRGGRTKRSPR